MLLCQVTGVMKFLSANNYILSQETDQVAMEWVDNKVEKVVVLVTKIIIFFSNLREAKKFSKGGGGSTRFLIKVSDCLLATLAICDSLVS